VKQIRILSLLLLGCAAHSGEPAALPAAPSSSAQNCSLVFICEKFHENVEVQRCLDSGPGFRYEYDLFTYSARGVTYVARSYLSETTEAHILRKQSGETSEPISPDDLTTDSFREFETYLRTHGKTRLLYLSAQEEGYIEIPR
jgi:hypothetical protein